MTYFPKAVLAFGSGIKCITVPGRVVIAAVGVHCIVVSAVEATVARRSPPPAHPAPAAAASLVLLLGRVGRRAPREQRVGQVTDEGNLEKVSIMSLMLHTIYLMTWLMTLQGPLFSRDLYVCTTNYEHRNQIRGSRVSLENA